MSNGEVVIDVAGVVTVPVTLKWSKKKYEFDISLTSVSTTSTGSYTGRSLKERVYELTGVPVGRQKLTGNSVPWKGILKDDFDFSVLLLGIEQDKNSLGSSSPPSSPLRVNLLGSAEILSGPPTTTKVFLEDLTQEERDNVERSTLEAAITTVTGYIPSLQVLPQHRGDDGRRQAGEMYAYNRLVHGLPQYQIERLLQKQQQQQHQHHHQLDQLTATSSLSPRSEDIPPSDIHADATTQLSLLMMEDGTAGNSQTVTNDHPSDSSVSMAVVMHPVGRVAMRLGLELQRAFINDLTVLDEVDGTLVCGLEDGHIQLWKHGQRTHDVLHPPYSTNITGVNGGVLSVLAIQGNTTITTTNGINVMPSHVAFATAGRGTVRLWTDDADEILAVSSPVPNAAIPTSLVQVRSTTRPTTSSIFSSSGLCLAVRYHIVRPQSQRPRLVPDDDMGRQRLAYLEAREMAVNEELGRLGRTVQVWYHDQFNINAGTTSWSSSALRSIELLTPASPVTCLVSWTDPLLGDGILAAGDAHGGIHIWKMVSSSSFSWTDGAGDLHFVPITSYQLTGPTGIGIVSITYLEDGTDRLVVSTSIIANAPTPTPSETSIPIINIAVSVTQAVHIVNVSNITAPYLDVSLNGHRDVVQCILQLPNGDLVTAGGKNDATMQVWSNAQLRKAVPQSNTRNAEDGAVVLTHAATPCLCKEVGYVFGLALLKDFKPGSNHFAIAAARYNVVKIIV